MRRLSFPHGLVVAFLLGALISAPTTASAQGLGLPVGTELPGFTLTDLEGTEVAISDVVKRGTPALIEIWATWCGVCRALAPQMEELATTYGEEELTMVAIAVAIAQTREDVARHIEREGHEWTFLWDGDGAAVRALDTAGTGIVLLVDAGGRIAYTGTGGAQDLKTEVAKLVGPR